MRRAPLSIGNGKPAAGFDSGSEPTKGTSESKAAVPPSESAKAAAEEEAAAPSKAPTLAIELAPRDADVSYVATAVTSEAAAPRAGVEGEGGAFLLPSAAVAETEKDAAMTVVSSPLPGPHHAILESTPSYSGPTPGGLDASGRFPLAELVERRAREQLADVALLRSSVEYALGNAAREVTTLKRELDAAKGTAWFSCPLGAFDVFVSSFCSVCD